MNPNIYNRPMFQNPQQRAGGGIMAGVAPINMSNGGDPNDTWAKAIPSFFGEQYKDAEYIYDQLPGMPTPSEAGRMYDEGINVDDLYGEGNFFSLDKTEAGSGMNFRDITDVLIMDPEDPMDLAIAASAVGMLAAPPGLIGVGLAKLGYTGVKIKRVLQRVAGLQKKLGDDELKNIQGSGLSGKLEERAREMGANPIDNLKRDSDVAGFAQNRFAPTTLGQYETTRFLSLPAQEAYDKINFISPAQASEAPYPEIPEYEGGPVKTAGIAAIETKDPKIDTLVREAETDAEGGIAKVARSIAEARSDEFKSPTFRRGDKDLAAVTKEDLIDAGYEGPDALTNYLNDMKFDDELGEYIKDIEAKGKADGGVVGFYTGGLAAVQRGLAAARAARLAAANKVNPPYSKKDLDNQMDARRGGPPSSPDRPAKTGGSDNTPVLPDGGTATKGGGKIKKTVQGVAVLGLGTAAYKYYADSAEAVTAAVGAGAPAAEIAALEAELAAAEKALAAEIKANETKVEPVVTKDEGNPLKQLFSKVRKGLSFDDPQKALYIAGQMMKPTEGFVPVNAFTAGTEAAIAYDKNKSEMARDQAAVDQVGTDLEREFLTLKSSAEISLGRELEPTEANDLLLYVRQDMQSKKALMTLFSTTAPDLINKNTVDQLSTSAAANYIRGIKV